MTSSGPGGSVVALIAAAALAGAAAWLAWPAPPATAARSRLRGLPRGDSLLRQAMARRPPGAAATTRRSPGSALELLLVPVGVLAAFATGYVVLVLLCPVLAVVLRRERRRSALRRETEARRAAVRQFCMGLSAELRAGRAPADAAERATVPLSGTGGHAPDQAPLLDLVGIGRAVASGVDPVRVLRAAARAPGAEALRRVATCWEVAASRGAGLADAIDRLVDGLLHEQSQRQEVAAQLAGARATARLLALLPAFGLLLGTGLGADPIHVLLDTPYGVACLLLGTALNVCGLVWTERLARAAEAGS